MGSVLIISLLVLMLLALLGVAAGTTATIEMRVAGNERIYRQNLLRAGGAAMTGAQALENTKDTVVLRESALPWVSFGRLPDPDPHGRANWEPSLAPAALDDRSRYIIVHAGETARGGSLDMEGSRVHRFDIYGRSDLNRGTVIVQVGWRKRF